MERTKYILLSIIVIMSAYNLNAQTDHSKAIYDAYVAGDMKEWVPVIEKMESEHNPTIDRRLELIGYYYGYIGYLIPAGERSVAKKYIDKGNKQLEYILGSSPDNAPATSLKGSFIAFRFAINKLRAAVSGMESKRLIEKGYKLDPHNVTTISEMANLLYYAPVLFGRDREKAVRLYETAARKMELEGISEANWFYLHLLTAIARHYDNEGMNNEADAAYRKILDAEPQFIWVKDELYPNFKARQDK